MHNLQKLEEKVLPSIIAWLEIGKTINLIKEFRNDR